MITSGRFLGGEYPSLASTDLDTGDLGNVKCRDMDKLPKRLVVVVSSLFLVIDIPRDLDALLFIRGDLLISRTVDRILAIEFASPIELKSSS
jgi:hypothetical protein